MNLRPAMTAVLFLLCIFSCTNSGRVRDSNALNVEFDLPPKQDMPVFRILNYKNMDMGAGMTPWLRQYMENGVAGLELMDMYRGSYLFISYIKASKKSVIDHWMEKYEPERDFPRLVVQRMQNRLDQDSINKPPDMIYGPNYEKVIKTAYYNTFWGAKRLDGAWVFGLPVMESEEENEDAEPEEPGFWGFILLGIPRETLEIQVTELLSRINNAKTKGGKAATKEQNAAFDYVKGHFFERF